MSFNKRSKKIRNNMLMQIWESGSGDINVQRPCGRICPRRVLDGTEK